MVRKFFADSSREFRAVFEVNPAAIGHAGWQKSVQAAKNNFQKTKGR